MGKEVPEADVALRRADTGAEAQGVQGEAERPLTVRSVKLASATRDSVARPGSVERLNPPDQARSFSPVYRW